jgi:hypothetical protein
VPTVFKQGFEGQMFVGAVGATASNLLLIVTEANYNFTTEKGNTTPRGDGSVPPIKTESVTQRVASIEFTVLNKEGDANLETLLTAMYSGAPIALLMKASSTASRSFDGDVILEAPHSQPLTGEQTLQFTAVPSRDGGREPSLT